jgi:hypothetical protein
VQRVAAVPQGESYVRVVRIRPPAHAKWETERAQHLAVSLFALGTPLRLRIQANRFGLEWRIEVPREHETAVVQCLYASYQKAQLDVESKDCTSSGFYAYSFHTAAPFIGPLQYVGDFGGLDPMPTLLGAMVNLMADEEMIYELVLRRLRPEYHKLGERLSKRSLVRWWDYLSFEGAVTATIAKASGMDKMDKFTPSLQRLVEAKLAAPLKEASLVVKVRAGGRARAHELVALVNPGLALFERPFCNFLVPAQERSFPLVLSPPEVAALWHLPSDQCQVPGIAWAASASVPMPALTIGENRGIYLGTNLYQGRSQTVWLPYADRVTHVTVNGKTGSGKSTILHHMIHQDIRAGKAVAVIDPHGDLVARVLAASIPPQRENDVVLFDMSDADYPVGLNFFSAPETIGRATVASMSLAVIRKMFAGSWSATRMEDALYAALMALQFAQGSTIRDVARMFHDSSFRTQVLRLVEDPVVLEFWYDEFEQLSAAHQSEFARPITNRLRKFYRNPRIGRVVGQKSSLDFRETMDSGKVFLASLAGLPDVEAETLGALIISKFQMAAMSRMGLSGQSRKPCYLYVDEVQRMKTSSLSTLLSEARKTGLSLVVANQFLKQLEGDTLESIMGNVGTMIVLPVGPKDAAVLAPFIRPQFNSDDLVNLSRFSAVVKTQRAGSALPAFSVRTPVPLVVPRDATVRSARIRVLSRSRYARHKDQVDQEMQERYQRFHQPAQTDSEGDAEEDYFG